MPLAYAPLYDVGRAVGKNAQNEPLDVLLVQFFLSNIYLRSSRPMQTQCG
jgi:hypothetical protein